MSIFEQIPRHNLHDILKKLDFKDFVNFKQCSQGTVELTKNFRYPLPFKCHGIYFDKDKIKMENKDELSMDIDDFMDEPVRFDAFFFEIKSSYWNGTSLEDFCKQKRITAYMLRNPIDTLDPVVVNNVIKLVKISSFCLMLTTPSRDLLAQPEFIKLKGIELCFVRIEEDDFLLQEATNISINFGTLTIDAIHKFLKQWAEGKRRIERMSIIPIVSDPADEMLNDLGCTIHYNHQNGQPPPVENQNVFYICSLTREDGKKLMIAIDNYKDITHKRILAGEYEGDDEEKGIRSKYNDIYAPGSYDS